MTTTIEKKLQFKKVEKEQMTTYEQIKEMRRFDLFVCDESNTQIMKRLDTDEADDIIDLLKKGNQVNLIA